jgi:hypothetical protein
MANGITQDELRAKIFECNDVKFEEVTVPEWGNLVVTIRSLTSEEKDAWEASILKSKKEGGKRVQRVDPINLRAKLVVAAAVVSKEDPLPLFKADDVAKLSGKSSAALDRLYTVAQRLAGFTDDDEAELAKT